MTTAATLPDLVTQASVRAALDRVSGSARLAEADPEVQHFATVEERLRSDPAEYLRWIERLGEDRLRASQSRTALTRSLTDISRLIAAAGLGAYAAAEAMQICLSDLILIESLDGADIPRPAIRMLRGELVTRSVELVNRLLRNMATRALAACQPRPAQVEHLARRLSELGPPVPVAMPYDAGVPVLVVVTAGRGTRLRSTIPKGLIPVGGIPMVTRIADAAGEAGIRHIVFVLKYRADTQIDYLARRGMVIVQDLAVGTAHSALAALASLRRQRAPVLLSYSDQPFVTRDSFSRPLTGLESADSDLIVSTLKSSGSELGRIIRDSDGAVRRIAQPRLGERGGSEADAGLYALRCDRVLPSLGNLRNDNVRGEYNLPDVAAELIAAGGRVRTAMAPAEEFQSVNTPRDLVLAQLREAAGLPLGASADVTAFFAALGAVGQSPESIASVGMERVMSLVGPVLDLRRGAE